MRLEKYHGLGNDFLVLIDVDGKQAVDAPMARALCDRHRGVGADGLIRATRATASPNRGHHVGQSVTERPRFAEAGAEAEVVMELWNADGSRAETSGNGLRCLARALVDLGAVDGPEVVIATDAGTRRATVHDDGTVTVEMGQVLIVERDGVWGHLGRDVVRWQAFVDAGNPHAVFGVDDPEKVDLGTNGRIWDQSLGGINVEYVVAGPGDAELTMRVWERGVGETMACGSGACAAVVAARHARVIEAGRVTVHQPGGDAVVDVSGDSVLLTGPAEHVFTAEVGDQA